MEAPAVLRQGDNNLLFFSGNRWDSTAYAIGYAHCAGPLGPCQQAAGPWIASQGQVHGPGGADVFRDTHDRPWMVFHAWIGPVGYPRGARSLLVVAINVTDGKPTITQH